MTPPLTDACLEFLLQYLPSMPIPPIDGEKDMMEYSVRNLDMSGFKVSRHTKLNREKDYLLKN